MSNQPSHQECNNYEECKKVALDRLRDAIALFKGERYTGTLYMAGYVIEIGIKAELYRLANKEISCDGSQLKDIIEHLTEGITPKKSLKDWLYEFPFPPKTLYELFVFFDNIASLHSSVKTTPKFTVIKENKYPKTKEGAFHNIPKFLEALNGWKKILNEGDFNSKTYNIKDWKVEIRYSYPSVDKTILEDDAKKALEISLRFLEEVLKIGNEIVQIRAEIERITKQFVIIKQEFINKEQGSINEYKTG